MNRIYGKPEAAVVAHVPPNPALPVLKSMGLGEKLELLDRLRRGELDDATTVLPLVEPARRPRSPTPANAVVVTESQVCGRKRTALDWMAVAAEEDGSEIVEVYLDAARIGDWRAAER
jgi:hypothetical protein